MCKNIVYSLLLIITVTSCRVEDTETNIDTFTKQKDQKMIRLNDFDCKKLEQIRLEVGRDKEKDIFISLPFLLQTGDTVVNTRIFRHGIYYKVKNSNEVGHIYTTPSVDISVTIAKKGQYLFSWSEENSVSQTEYFTSELQDKVDSLQIQKVTFMITNKGSSEAFNTTLEKFADVLKNKSDIEFVMYINDKCW